MFFLFYNLLSPACFAANYLIDIRFLLLICQSCVIIFYWFFFLFLKISRKWWSWCTDGLAAFVCSWTVCICCTAKLSASGSDNFCHSISRCIKWQHRPFTSATYSSRLNVSPVVDCCSTKWRKKALEIFRIVYFILCCHEIFLYALSLGG